MHACAWTILPIGWVFPLLLHFFWIIPGIRQMESSTFRVWLTTFWIICIYTLGEFLILNRTPQCHASLASSIHEVTLFGPCSHLRFNNHRIMVSQSSLQIEACEFGKGTMSQVGFHKYALGSSLQYHFGNRCLKDSTGWIIEIWYGRIWITLTSSLGGCSCTGFFFISLLITAWTRESQICQFFIFSILFSRCVGVHCCMAAFLAAASAFLLHNKSR